MRAHEHAGGCDFAQHFIQDRPVTTIDDWVDPNQRAVDTHELRTQLLDSVVDIGCTLHVDALVCKRRSNPGKARVLQSSLSPTFRVSGKHDGHPVAPFHHVNRAPSLSWSLRQLLMQERSSSIHYIHTKLSHLAITLDNCAPQPQSTGVASLRPTSLSHALPTFIGASFVSRGSTLQSGECILDPM